MSSIIKATSVEGQPLTDPSSNYKLRVKPKPKDIGSLNTQMHDSMSVEERHELAEKMVDEAKQKAAEIVEQANSFRIQHMQTVTTRMTDEYNAALIEAKIKGLDEGKKEGFDEGFEEGKQEGYQAGMKKGERDFEDLKLSTIKKMYEVIEGIKEGKEALIDSSKEELFDLALYIAQVVLKQKLSIEPAIFEQVLVHAASQNKNQAYLIVKLSQANYNLFAPSPSLKHRLEVYADDVKFMIDPNMADTDCIIETPIGVIDAGVDTQITNIQEHVKE